MLSGKVDHIYGAVNGIEGVLAEKFLDLGKKLDSAEKISLLMQTPAAALGSCRYKLGDPKENTEDFEEILRIFRRHEIRYFIYIGGNDSMDTVNKLSKYCKENGVRMCLLSAHQRRSTRPRRNGSLPGLWLRGKISGSNLCRAGKRLPRL